MTSLTATIRLPPPRPSHPATTTTSAVAARARTSSRTARSLPDDGGRPVVAAHRPGHHRPDRQLVSDASARPRPAACVSEANTLRDIAAGLSVTGVTNVVPVCQLWSGRLT